MRPRENPAIGELRGRLIRLRPFQPEEIEYAWQGLALQDEAAHPRRTREDWRAQPSDRFRRRLTRSGKFWRGCLDLAIEREAKLIGDIQARTSPTQTLPNGVFEVGVILHQTEDRGKGYGREAVE